MIKGSGVPFILLIVVLTLRPHLAGSVYAFAQGLFLIPLLVGMALIFLLPGSAGSLRRETGWILVLPWFWLMWMLVSMVWTSDPGQGLREVVGMAGNVTVFSLTFLLVYEKRGDRDRILPVLGLVVTPVIISAVYQRFIGLEKIRETLRAMEAAGEDVMDLSLIVADDRVFGGFLNPNMLAGFLAVTLALTVDLFLTSSDKGRAVFTGSLVLIQLYALFLTGSVGGSAAAAVGVFLVLLSRKGVRSREFAMACIAVPWSSGHP